LLFLLLLHLILKKKILELESQIKMEQMKVLEQKQKMGGVNASKENDAMIAKQIRTLENRLEKVLTKFNKSLAEVKGGERKEGVLMRRTAIVAAGVAVMMNPSRCFLS